MYVAKLAVASLLYECVGGKLLAVVIQSHTCTLLMESNTDKCMEEWGVFTSLEQQMCYVAGCWEASLSLFVQTFSDQPKNSVTEAAAWLK